jgi:hypothetical protein
MTLTKHGEFQTSSSRKSVLNLVLITFRPSLFDDFVEFEIDRLKKLQLKEQEQGEDDSNNNIKSSLNGGLLNSSNMLQAN